MMYKKNEIKETKKEKFRTPAAVADVKAFDDEKFYNFFICWISTFSCTFEGKTSCFWLYHSSGFINCFRTRS